MRRRRNHRETGFTLVEAIIVIAIIGVIGGIVAVFIRLPVQNYADSVARAEVTDEADLALRRMARELRMALPNSIRVNSDGSAIEFLLTKTGGRYLALEDNAASTSPILDFSDKMKTTVTLIGALNRDILTTDYFVVYNLGGGVTPSDAWAFSDVAGNRNIARVKTALPAGTSPLVLELTDNPFGAQTPPMPSPENRYQIVSGPVTFACSGLVLTRYAGYSINATQVNPPTGASSVAPLTRRAINCAGIFTYDAAAQRSALVNITLELAPRAVAGTTATSAIRLVHQVHVDNTP